MLCIIISIISWRKRKLNFKDAMKVMCGKASGRDIISGLVISLIAMAGIFFIENKLSFININDVNITRISIGATIEILLMAIYEEFVFRGLMLNGLNVITKNKYMSVLISAAIFGIVHAANPHATTISVISNGLGGIMYSIAYLERKSLFFSTAVHFGWNFFQGILFGFPISGIVFPSIISQNIIMNNETLMGGLYGPEGGIIGIGFRFLVIVLILVYVHLITKKCNSK